MSTSWFLADPEIIEGKRVDLNLGLRGSIRFYNDLTAPGIGNVSFIRQLTWSCLALYYSEELNESSTKLANAIEAFGLKAYYNSKKGNEYQFRGSRAFARTSWDDLNSYKALSTKNNYVQITYRQSTTRSLPYTSGIGLVDSGAVFSNYVLSSSGRELIENLEKQYNSHKHGSILKKWIEESRVSTFETVAERFGPLSTTNEKNDILIRLNSFVAERIDGSVCDYERRQRIISIFDKEKEEINPKIILQLLKKHDYKALYSDMEKAIEFYKMLNDGQIILGKIFQDLITIPKLEVNGQKFKVEIDNLKKSAQIYLQTKSPISLNIDARSFAESIVNSNFDEVIIEIVNREKKVSDIVDGNIVRGQLYREDIAKTKFELVQIPKTFMNFYSLWKECNER